MATLIDDATATDYFNRIDTAPEDQRQQMADDLLAWGKAKKAQEYNDTDEHFSKLFTDKAYFEQEKQANAAVQESPDPDQAAKRTLIGAWLQHRSGRPIDTMSYQVERDAYAMANYGKKNLDDNQLFDFISGEYNTQKKKTEAINDLQMQSVGKAIADSQLGQNRPFVDGMTEVFNQWQQKYPELVDGQNDAAFLSQGYKLYYDTINDLDTVRPQASKALSTLTSFTQGNATDEDMQSLANDFVGAPPEDRQKIYKYVTLAAQAGQIDRAGIEQFAINMGQAFTRGFDFVPQGSLQLQEAGVSEALQAVQKGGKVWVPQNGDITKATISEKTPVAQTLAEAPTAFLFSNPKQDYREATPEEAGQFTSYAKKAIESFKVVRELRNVAKTGVDPIRPVLEENSFWGTAERGAYGLSGSIPLMGATAVNPFLGVLAYQATEYDRIMLENPEINPQFAQGLALVEGAANAAIDRVQLSSLSGRLPMFGRYLDRIASDGVRRTVKIGANVVEQNLQEGAQDLIAPVLETAVAALREDMPDKDFTKLMDDWSGQRAETFFATLPLALIGGGVATYRDIKNPSAELNATKLRMAGFGKDQVTFIQRAETPEEYDARIKMEWEKRTPENIKAGEQEVLNTIEKARTPGELDARMQRVTAPDGSEDIVVTSPDGKELLRTKSEQAALEAVRQHNEAQLLNRQFDTKYEPEELRQIINDRIANWKSQDSNNTLVMESEGMNAQQKLEQLQAAGNAAQIQELHNRIANSPLKDTPYEQINILGEASVNDVAEMVFQPLIKINPNTRPENLREEIHHIGVKVALKNGSVTLDTLRGWLDATEKALPDIFPNLVRDTEGDIVESLAQVQAAYEDGKIDTNEASNLPASFIDYIKNMMRTFAEVLRRAVALRGAFKDGALPAEYETFLADSVGLNQQARVDTASNRVSKEIITDGGQMLMDFSIGSRSNAVSTDTPSIRASNATITGPANYSIGAFHGTPHKVDKFSTAKIGTGEGAQVYGWGLYFAEKFGVAKKYRDDLTPDPVAKINKHLSLIGLGGHSASSKLAEKLVGNGGDLSLASSEFRKEGNKQIADLIDKRVKEGRKSLDVNKGNLYTVELDVELEDLLDWDKPLSEQSEKIRNGLASAFGVSRDAVEYWTGRLVDDLSENGPSGYSENRLNRVINEAVESGGYGEEFGFQVWDEIKEAAPEVAEEFIDWVKKHSAGGIATTDTGESLYRLLASTKGSPKAASEAILAAGIPGIRYLDGDSRAEGQGSSNYVIFDENLIRITEENGNRIPASQALAAPAPGATNYSIGMTVAPLRRDSLSELNKKEMQKRASSAKFIHLQQVIDDVANAYGVKIESRQPVIGGWVESGQISLEVPEAILFDTDDLEMAQEMAAIVGASAPELQNAVMLWKDDDAGKDTVLEFQAKGADSALAIAKDLNNAGLNGFTYDTKTRKFSLVLAGVSPESIPKVYDYINDQSKTGNISSRGGTQARSGVAAFPSESDYRGYLQGARSRADLLQQGQREALLDVVDRAERRVDRYAAALKISEQAKKIQKKLKRPSTSALAIETELKGKQFDNIRQLGLYLDARFNKVFGKPSFEIGGQEGIDIASDAFVYDIIDGLAGDGSGMGWYDERVQETIRELSKLHPEFATDSNALAVYIGILATTSQGYTVVENFKQANKVYNEYKRTGRIPTDFKFAKSSDPINSNLAQIQGLIDEHGLDGYAEFMDREVTGQALRDQFGKTPTGVTLKDTVRGNRVLGPKIGSFFNNLRGQFDTITMDLWYTRTMHRFLGETVVPLDSDKMQKAITKFREELKNDGVRTYGIDINEALKDDEATVQAALTLFQRWARGDNDYTEKGYFKFPDGYKIEKAARGIFSIGGMKGAPQNKTHRQYFAKVVLEAKAKLAKLGMKLTEADMQAIIWYREKNLFARTGVANAAAKPADYLDAVMVARSGAQAQEDIDPADLEAEDGDTNYSIASQSEIDRVNRALGGMNRGPEGRLAIYERAKQKFAQVLQSNKESLDAIKSATPIDTTPAIDQVESERAARLADLTTEETSEVEKALQDNADTFMPRIEDAPTLAERKRVERDAKDRAKILEQGIRDKYAERKTAIETEANTKRQQIEQSAASRDSASRARMSEKVRRTKLLQAIGELDAILSVLPPEVRGRVGGFAVLANIGTGDKALGDFFVKRIDMIDRQLERTLKEEYGTAFDSLLERTKPKKAAAGEKPKGIGADIQSLFAVVREARNWSAEKVDGHIANIETQIASGNLTAEEEAMLTREADLVSLAGDWKNADSSRRAAALSAVTETWAKGMSAFVQKKIREREDRDMARAEAISATGKKGDYVGRRKRSAADNGLRGKVHGWFMDTLAWDGVVNILFGHESPMAIRLSDGQRKAEYAKIDAVAAKEEAIHDLFTKLADGNRAAGEKLMWQMSQPSISANGLNLSELEALSATMLWMQEDGRRHMEGELNENGMPVGKWHYDQKFIDDIESALSPEAKAVRDYLLDAYGKEWFSINSVYRDLNGVNLPRIQNYSPVTVVPINAPAGMVTDPVTGNSVSATSISPGALRTRGTAIAEPAFRNVVQTYLAHTRQMEHWKAFAPWIKEANGILRFRDVQNSIKEAGGEEATGVLNRYLDAFSQGGNRDASLGLEISQVLNRMASRAAQVALIGRVGTLAIQTTQIGAASAELPMGAYVYRLGKLLTGNLGWGDSLNSAYIQRRLKQMPPIVQIAMEGLKAGKPNQLKHQVEKIGRLISGSDALWTAGTYAMVYDYNLSQAKTLGYTGKAAEDYAHNTAERITDRLAQPTRMGAKSIYEVTATNPGSRLGWAFASEARKNLALLAYTKANRPLKRFGATALGFIVFNLAMGAFIRNAWKDIRDDGDDEDEFFDAKTWNWKRIGVAMATEPLQGIPYLGDYIEKGINAALGQYHQSSDLINFERGVRAIRNIPDIVQGEREMADVLKDIDGMVSLMGLFNQNAAAAASLTHIASDFFGVVENATEE
jgi:hypothetical protein